MTSTAPTVNQNNIHTHFATLQADRDRLRNEVNDLERARRKEEQTLRELRSTQAETMKRIRDATDILGKAAHQKSSILSDQERLRRIKDEEEQQLKALSEEIEQGETQKRADKKAYVDELCRVNSNAQNDLFVAEERKLVMGDDVSCLLKEMWNNNSSNANDKGAISSPYAELMEASNISTAKLREIEQVSNDWVLSYKDHAGIHKEILKLKSKVKSDIGLTDELFREMESKWEEEWHAQRKQMRLLEDSSVSQSQMCADPVDTSELCDSNHGQDQDGQDVHMELFYGSSGN